LDRPYAAARRMGPSPLDRASQRMSSSWPLRLAICSTAVSLAPGSTRARSLSIVTSCSMRARMRPHSSHVEYNQRTPGEGRLLRGKLHSSSTEAQMIPALYCLSFRTNLFSVPVARRRMLELCLATAVKARSRHTTMYSRGYPARNAAIGEDAIASIEATDA